MDKTHVIDKLNNVQMNTEPFNYLLIDELLQNNDYKNISNELESFNFNSVKTNNLCNNLRKQIYLTINDKKNNDTIFSKNYYKINCEYTKNFINFLVENEDYIYNHLTTKFKTKNVPKNNRYLHISMVKDYNGYEIIPHQDGIKTLFTGLIYLPLDDSLKNNGLTIYKEDGGSYQRVKYKREDDNRNIYKYHDQDIYAPLDIYDIIQFLPNRLIIFAPYEKSWHSVEKLQNIKTSRNAIQFNFMSINSFHNNS